MKASSTQLENPVVNAFVATTFPLVVWLVSGVPVWSLLPWLVIAAIGWAIALTGGTRPPG
ncbi:MAG TPA: hypothetical protein PLF81_00795 [Candidatus Anammoximicrobium sp.]|nr:hypothetical protein [Candidatus Anammoximicrobium sp.]